MFEPPDSANRLPVTPGKQPHARSRPREVEATVSQTGTTRTADLLAALPGTDQQALDGVSRVVQHDAAAGAIEHSERRTVAPDGAARQAQRDDATRAVAHNGAPPMVERERPAPVFERQGATRMADDPSAASWSHDWLKLSHELRTPLNAILGNIELLLDGSAGPLAASARACIGDIQLASRQLLTQLQPLLLLVQARTSGALATRTRLDLLALIRQASADTVSQPEPWLLEQSDTASQGGACLSDTPRLMVCGDPIWLGALAAALVDLRAASPGAGGPLSIIREPTESDDCSVVLRASWEGLDPASTSPLPLALIDAVVALHGGRILEFGADGLRLNLPADVAGPGASRQGCR